MKRGTFEASFFALRTPLLCFADRLSPFDAVQATHAYEGQAEPEAAWKDAINLVRQRLAASLRDTAVREALFLGSPALYERLAFTAEKEGREGARGVERALYCYLARMSSRPTPFGLFAGCSVGRVGYETRLEVCSREGYRRRSRLDMEYLNELAELVAKDSALHRELMFRPNSSLYKAGAKYRYTEGRKSRDRRLYNLVTVDETPALRIALQNTREGMTAGELAATLVSEEGEISLGEAEEFVGELIDNQVIVPDIAPVVTGGEAIGDVIHTLKGLQGAGPIADGLEEARIAIKQIDQAGVGVNPEAYEKIAERLRELPAAVNMAHLFQVDMTKPAPQAMVSMQIVGEILKAVEIVHRMMPPEGADPFLAFRSAFSERYQEREVPLVEVLDEEAGIGFERSHASSHEASPLLKGIVVPAAPSESKVFWNKRRVCLLELLAKARETGLLELQLGSEELEDLSSDVQVPLPTAFSAIASIAAKSQEEVGNGQYRILLHGAYGPSGARLLGRFCHADDNLLEAVMQHLRAEEAHAPDAIFAEIVHLPEGRTGNVLHRPCLRDFEIPFLGRSGASRERQIPVTDLLVSVRGGRVVIRSKRLDKEIIPRLTSAHNFGLSTNLKLYKFLCLIQSQGMRASVRWSWGVLEQSAFLPRISYGRLTFCRARWRLNGLTIELLSRSQDSRRFTEFHAWSAARRLPRFVALADADKELLIDRDNPLAVDALIDHIKDRSTAILVEMFPGPDELCCAGPEGRFVHQIVVPFVRKPEESAEKVDGNMSEPRKASAIAAGSRLPAKASTLVKRSFAPGSDWLFAKLYTSPSHADRLLQEVVAPMAQEVLGSEAVDQWFFIRYGDPEWHLRVRFHGSSIPLLKGVAPLLYDMTVEPMAEALLWRLQFDTYDREIERYGGPRGIELCERLFHHDSEAVLRLLAMSSGDTGAEARWKLALVGIDYLLSDLGLNLPGKHRLLSSLRDAFGREFNVGGAFRKSVSKRFRAERACLDQLLDREFGLQTDLAPGVLVFKQRSEAWRPITQEVADHVHAGRLTCSLHDLAASLVHMHVNRMMRSAHRAQELVLYHFLTQVYESKIARARKGASASGAFIS